MARFPDREADIRALAQNLVTGLAASTAEFPTPPVPSADLQALLDSFIALCDQQIAAQAAAEQVTQTKRAALDELAIAMRADLRYAEGVAGNDDAKLSVLGWGAKAAPTALTVPGQPRALEAPRQGEGWVFLDWKEPAEGGPVAAYRIERRERPSGDWALVSMALETEATLNNQERGKDLEYRVVALNKAGESAPSNTVAAVL